MFEMLLTKIASILSLLPELAHDGVMDFMTVASTTLERHNGAD